MAEAAIGFWHVLYHTSAEFLEMRADNSGTANPQTAQYHIMHNTPFAEGRKLRTSRGGVAVRVEITTREQLPSGNAPGHPIDAHLPDVDLIFKPTETRANGNGNIIQGTSDVTDIVGTSLRVVSGRVTSIRDL